jgi:tetratricopeptide (TPR) repeat protein
MADVWSEIAGLLVRQGRLDEALAAYKRLVETAPYDPAAIVSVAQVLVELRRFDQAKAQAQLALKLLPATEARWRATAHKLLMRIALAAGDGQAARAEARLGEQEDPTLPLTSLVEGLSNYEAGDFAAALPHFQEALRRSAGRTFEIPDLHFYIGDSLARLERHAEAEAHLLEEVRLFPGSIRARSGLAMLYRVQGRDQDVARTIEAMLRVSPTPAGYEMAEKLWAMFGEPARAAAVRAARRSALQEK